MSEEALPDPEMNRHVAVIEDRFRSVWHHQNGANEELMTYGRML